MHPDVTALANRQCGMLARRQLTSLGMDWNAVDRQIRAGRWAECSPRVVCTTTGALTVDQQRWLGVLHAGPRSILGALTAGARRGLRGWERVDVTVLVDDELSFEPVPGIAFFRSRRPFDLLTDPRPGIPCARLEPALLLWAGYDASLRAAHGVLAAAVQQRLTTPQRLSSWLEQLRPLRRASGFRSMLRDVEGGVHSGAERDVARMCRRYDLPQPDRQTARVDASGRRRWTDCEWRLPGGGVLVLEVDGAFHMEVTQWTADIRRDRRLTAPDRMVVRASAFEVRHEPGEVAADLISLGVRPLRGESCAWDSGIPLRGAHDSPPARPCEDARVGEVFECEIQARLRDVNLGGHVDNVEALRVLDEARLLFFRHAPLIGSDRPGLLRELPSGIVELVGSQRIDYHAEMRFVAFQPFLVRMWVGHVGRSSLAISYELRVAPDQPPAIVAESSVVFWDPAAGSSWAISDEVRATLASYTRAPVELRERPGR